MPQTGAGRRVIGNKWKADIDSRVVSRAERIFDYEQVAHGTALQGFNGDLFFLTANILFKQPRSVEAV
jgi:hypothetical protein